MSTSFHFNCLQHLEFPVKVMPQLNTYPSYNFSQCTQATMKCNLVFKEPFFTGVNGHKCLP